MRVSAKADALCLVYIIVCLINVSNENKVWIAVKPAQSNDEKNVSDAELAELIGVSRQTVNYWINGQRDVTLSRLHEVADVLGVRVRDLFI